MCKWDRMQWWWSKLEPSETLLFWFFFVLSQNFSIKLPDELNGKWLAKWILKYIICTSFGIAFFCSYYSNFGTNKCAVCVQVCTANESKRTGAHVLNMQLHLLLFLFVFFAISFQNGQCIRRVLARLGSARFVQVKSILSILCLDEQEKKVKTMLWIK